MTRTGRRWLGGVSVLLVAAAALALTPMGSAFTYQGQLKQNSVLLTGTADFQFTLYDALSGGAQVGSTVTVSNVAVVNGLFTVQLDFGTGVFLGSARWLQIDVRAPAGGGAYTPLSPRQAILPVPYSTFALDADLLDGQHGAFYQDAGNLTTGTISEARLPQNAIDSTEIEDGSITTADLANNAVTSAKIADGNVSTVDLADNSVTTGKILDGTITTADLADSSVTTGKILDGSVATADLADNSVTTNKILDGTIATADLADNSVTSAKIADGAVTINDLADNSVTSVKIADGNVATVDLADSAVTSGKIANGTILEVDLADSAVTSAKIANSTIATVDLADGAVTSAKIADGTIVNADISASAAIAASKISGTAWTFGTEGYPPRAAGAAGGGFQTTSGSYTTVTSVSITVPEYGYVFAEASAAAGYWTGAYEGMFALGFGSTSEDYYSERWLKMPSLEHEMSISTSRLKSMNAGTYTIYFLAKRTSGTDPLWFPRYTLSVMFIEKGSSGLTRDSVPEEPPPQYRPEEGVEP